MDVVFKDKKKVFAFAKLSSLEPECELHVKHIRQLWNAVGNLIDHNKFYSMFSAECANLALSYENYHMEAALENANMEWAMELIVLIAERIAPSYHSNNSTSNCRRVNMSTTTTKPEEMQPVEVKPEEMQPQPEMKIKPEMQFKPEM